MNDRKSGNKAGGMAQRINYFYIKNIRKWICCPSCQRGRMTFNRKSLHWQCEDCKYSFSEEYLRNDVIFWFCDECGAYLNEQEEFEEKKTKHICCNCGYENDITEEFIRNCCIDCGEKLSHSEGKLCAACKQNRRNKAKRWLITAGKIVGTIVVVAGVAYLVVQNRENEENTESSPIPDGDDYDPREGTTVYTTNEWKGYGKQNYYWNEYRFENGRVVKYKCHRQKVFDGDENNWYEEERIEDTWDIDDPTMPEWIRKYI